MQLPWLLPADTVAGDFKMRVYAPKTLETVPPAAMSSLPVRSLHKLMCSWKVSN
jgi:hypothetical protein